MTQTLTWTQLCRSADFRGCWVALDNCRYDQSTMQPVEGDLVDSDAELSELCSRMRESGRTSCEILFCEADVIVETPIASPRQSEADQPRG